MRTSPIMQLLWFMVGFGIAAVLVLLLGCTPSSDTGVYREPEIVLIPETPPSLPEPRQCCAALIPSCEACKENVSVEYWLKTTCGEGATDAEYADWDPVENEPIWLCQMTIVN